jgi:hypothetical protein
MLDQREPLTDISVCFGEHRLINQCRDHSISAIRFATYPLNTTYRRSRPEMAARQPFYQSFLHDDTQGQGFCTIVTVTSDL